MAEYIEREAVKAAVRKRLNSPTIIGWLCRIIDTCAAADVEPVVHGRWIRRGNEKKCSECGFIYYSNHDEWNGCPNCLARMDGVG